MTFPQQMIDNMTPAERVRYGYPLPEDVALDACDAMRRLEMLEEEVGATVPSTGQEVEQYVAGIAENEVEEARIGFADYLDSIHTKLYVLLDRDDVTEDCAAEIDALQTWVLDVRDGLGV